ncbi:DUF3883 domain-containing protein [Christensenellaceae bacterium OttesenSCG-928-L17]|nr:DUF3883 domain-containing protein [Christensenellaceae bacterium OttesenSCG-928-L17]
MSYNHANQYRCTIIRGKAKNDLDNLLPTYAQIIDEITPVASSDFASAFNSSLSVLMPEAEKKTLDNHRTEIAGKLFGMYYEQDNTIFTSERTRKFLADNDQPAFFKDMCFRFQFPNGLDKIQTLLDRLDHGVRIRPFCFTMKLVLDAYNADIVINQNEIAYYALNNLDVLSGKATTEEVIKQIKLDRAQKIVRRVSSPDKAESYNTQHIREQLNYLELANLIRNNSGNIFPNLKEEAVIKQFSEKAYILGFDVYEYNLNEAEEREKFYEDWQLYYSGISKKYIDRFATSVEALQYDVDETGKQISRAYAVDTMLLGDDGEALVFKYENERISAYDSRLTNKIHMLGKTKGLGYDILSIFADEREETPEFAKYIEVKSTKRVTSPNIESEDWVDTLNVTRNEWVAAQQYGDSFEIYRIYFTQAGPELFIIKNPFEKNERKIIKTIPTMYRLDFSSKAIDKVVSFA